LRLEFFLPLSYRCSGILIELKELSRMYYGLKTIYRFGMDDSGEILDDDLGRVTCPPKNSEELYSRTSIV